MGEIEDAVRELWPLTHSSHPGYNEERGECIDCPLARPQYVSTWECWLASDDGKKNIGHVDWLAGPRKPAEK